MARSIATNATDHATCHLKPLSLADKPQLLGQPQPTTGNLLGRPTSKWSNCTGHDSTTYASKYIPALTSKGNSSFKASFFNGRFSNSTAPIGTRQNRPSLRDTLTFSGRGTLVKNAVSSHCRQSAVNKGIRRLAKTTTCQH